MVKRIIGLAVLALCFCAGPAGCVDQHPEADSAEKELRIVGASRAVVEICDRLALPLAGVPAVEELPPRYDGAARVGSPMGPDLEAIKLINPTDVLSPDTLEATLAESYANAGLPVTFLNLRSVAGLYESAVLLGDRYGRRDKAAALAAEYEAALADIREAKDRAGGVTPRVLVLMGLPGAYVAATQNSYAGSLAELAGGVNAALHATEEFVSWNTEELLLLDPDIILRTAHAMPDRVAAMFAEEFAGNDVWSHFRAVREGRVYDLDYQVFAMSANFRWPEAVETLKAIYYTETDGGTYGRN
jgi:iron complex transport system substrate-binding protein